MTNNLFEEFGLTKIINASGKMTALGASAVSDEVANALKAAAQDYVNIDELIEYAGKVIAHHTCAEDGCPTIGASADETWDFFPCFFPSIDSGRITAN